MHNPQRCAVLRWIATFKVGIPLPKQIGSAGKEYLKIKEDFINGCFTTNFSILPQSRIT